jgi:hypothetical protein
VDWYGGRRQAMRLVTGTALWHAPRLAPVAIRWDLARDSDGEERDAAYLCADERRAAAPIVATAVALEPAGLGRRSDLAAGWWPSPGLTKDRRQLLIGLASTSGF